MSFDICSICIGLSVQKPNGPIMAVVLSTSIGLPLKKSNLANSGCHICERLPRNTFVCLMFFRTFKTGKILFLAKGLPLSHSLSPFLSLFPSLCLYLSPSHSLSPASLHLSPCYSLSVYLFHSLELCHGHYIRLLSRSYISEESTLALVSNCK